MLTIILAATVSIYLGVLLYIQIVKSIRGFIRFIKSSCSCKFDAYDVLTFAGALIINYSTVLSLLLGTTYIKYKLTANLIQNMRFDTIEHMFLVSLLVSIPITLFGAEND